MFIEAESPRPWLPLLLVLFAVMIGLGGWLPELSEWEARYMLAAQAWVWGDGIELSQRAPGVTSMLPPLPVWFLALLVWLRAWPGEGLVRVAAAIPAAGLAVGCAWVSHRVAGRAAAAVTAAMLLGTLALQKAEHVNVGALLFAALLNAAWLVWFYFSREHKHWLYAWTVALLLVGLAALAGGTKAFLLFYLPLAILRRPLSPWKRLSRPEHWISLALVGGLVALTLALTPGAWQATTDYLAQLEPPALQGGYLPRFLLFPLLTLGACLPWVAFAWPAFCAGFSPLEKHPVLSQWLRTVVVVVFCLYWISPDGRPKDLLPLLGPVAILTGMHYDLLVRRHGRQLRWVPRTLAVVALVLAGLGVLGWLLAGVQVSWVLATLQMSEFVLPGWVTLLGVTGLALALLLGGVALRARAASPLWLVTMLAVVALQGAWVGTAQVYRYCRNSEHRQLAAALTAGLPPGARLLAVSSDLKLHAPDYYALDRPVYNIDRRLDGPADSRLDTLYNLPPDPEVYVLKGNRTPVNRFREWTPMGPPCTFGGDKVRVYRGTRRGVVSAPVPVSPTPVPVTPPAPGPAIVPIPAVAPSTAVVPGSPAPAGG